LPSILNRNTEASNDLESRETEGPEVDGIEEKFPETAAVVESLQVFYR
jgi:hypothetical protein